MNEVSNATTTKAIWAFVFSLLGLIGFCPFIGPILGLVLAMGERSSLASAARIISWITIVLTVLGILVVVALVIVGGMTVPFLAH